MSTESALSKFPPLKRLRYKLELFALESAAALIVRLPYGALKPLADVLGAVAFTVDNRGRSTAIANLTAVFPELQRHERRRIARRSYQNFARTMLCLFWSPRITKENYSRYFRTEGLDANPIHRDRTRPGIYFCFHFSNFEWLSHASAFEIQTGPIIFQRFKNPLLGPVFSRLRATSGHEIIPQERALVRMLKVLKAGGKFGCLTDLSLDPRFGAVAIKCFGLWTASSPLLSVLRSRTGAALIPCEAIPENDGTYRMVYHPEVHVPPDATAEHITQACWNALEPSIRARPELWLWAYKQWRFRPSFSPPETYPAYANTAKRFDSLVKHAGTTQM